MIHDMQQLLASHLTTKVPDAGASLRLTRVLLLPSAPAKHGDSAPHAAVAVPACELDARRQLPGASTSILALVQQRGPDTQQQGTASAGLLHEAAAASPSPVQPALAPGPSPDQASHPPPGSPFTTYSSTPGMSAEVPPQELPVSAFMSDAVEGICLAPERWRHAPMIESEPWTQPGGQELHSTPLLHSSPGGPITAGRPEGSQLGAAFGAPSPVPAVRMPVSSSMTTLQDLVSGASTPASSSSFRRTSHGIGRPQRRDTRSRLQSLATQMQVQVEVDVQPAPPRIATPTAIGGAGGIGMSSLVDAAYEGGGGGDIGGGAAALAAAGGPAGAPAPPPAVRMPARSRWHKVTLRALPDGTPGVCCGPALLLSACDVHAEVSRLHALTQEHARMEALLAMEHKFLEAIFPRHVLEHIAHQAGIQFRSGGGSHPGRASGTGSGSYEVPRSPGLGGGSPHSEWDAGLAVDSPRSHVSSTPFTLAPGALSPRTASAGLSAPWTRQAQDTALPTLATRHECVTVLFADIVGFTSMCNSVDPMTVMAFLNGLYTRFDELCDIYGVYKVETIGDCYMVVGGLVAVDEEGYHAVRDEGAEDALHALKVMSFAKAMLREVAGMAMPHNGQRVQLRVGLHSGPVMAGIVGAKMPRFCLFGDTVNTASRMETSCQPGAVHASAATQALLPSEAWQAQTPMQVKGKGEMATFAWTPPPAAPPGSAGTSAFALSLPPKGASCADWPSARSPEHASEWRSARGPASDGEAVREMMKLAAKAAAERAAHVACPATVQEEVESAQPQQPPQPQQPQQQREEMGARRQVAGYRSHEA